MNEHALQVVLASVISFFLGAGIVSLVGSDTTMCSAPAPRAVQQMAYMSDIEALESRLVACGGTNDLSQIQTGEQIRNALTNLLTELRNLPSR